MDWEQFVERIIEWLRGPDSLSELSVRCDKEHDLTKAIVGGIRKQYIAVYGVEHAADIHSHVVYRQGEAADQRAWKSIKKYKWVIVWGRNNVPDVMVIRNEPGSPEVLQQVLPIEVKLLRSRKDFKDIPRGVGQCFAYRTQYPKSILFVGVARGLPFNTRAPSDIELQETLERQGISMIVKEVGLARP